MPDISQFCSILHFAELACWAICIQNRANLHQSKVTLLAVTPLVIKEGCVSIWKCISTGTVGSRSRRSLGLHFAPPDFEALSTIGTRKF
jgi:hypothetical protein